MVEILFGIFLGLIVGIPAGAAICFVAFEQTEKQNKKRRNQKIFDETAEKLADMLERARNGEEFEIRR